MLLLGCYVLASLLVVNFGLAGLLEGSSLLEAAGFQAPEQRTDALRRWNGAKARVPAGRIVSAVRPDHEPRFNVVFVGLSSLRDGLDMALFNRLQAGRAPSLSLSGSGGSFERLEYSVAPVLEDPAFDAGYVLVMAHPIWLAGWDPKQVVQGTILTAVEHAVAGRFGPIKRWLKGSVWLASRRLVLTQGLDAHLEAARVFAQGVMGVPATQIYKPHRDPWARAPLDRPTQNASRAQMRAQWGAWTAMGKWRPESYAGQMPKQLAALKRLVTAAQLGARKVVVLRMPESAALRKAVPQMAREALSAPALHKLLGDEVMVWDLSGLLDDDAFFDNAHPNQRGRAALTKALAERCL